LESLSQKVGTEHWSRFCAREQKPDVCRFFLSIWTFASLLGIVFDLFVPFGRTVETQNVLQRWFWRLRGVWPIFVTCRSILNLSSEFGCVLQVFFFVTAVLTRAFFI
jgi:hypothetical protein